MTTIVSNFSYGRVSPGLNDSVQKLLAWFKQLLDGMQARPWTGTFRQTSVATSSVALVGESSMQWGYSSVTALWDWPEDSGISALFKPYLISEFRQLLDQHSADRLALILDTPSNWNGAGAKQLDVMAAINCIGWLSRGPLVNRDVGVFLTPDGELALNWPANDDGEMAEISFGISGCALYVPGWDDTKHYISVDDESLSRDLARFL